MIARFAAPTILAALAVVFGSLACLDLLRHPAGPSHARRTWARIAVAFAVVSGALYWLQGR